MLWSDDVTAIDYIPHEAEYRVWRDRITDPEFEAMRREIHGILTAKRIITSRWIPGEDWTGTPWEPIYERACGQNFDAAGKCYGLFLWVIMLEHPDDWIVTDESRDDGGVGGKHYFRKPA